MAVSKNKSRARGASRSSKSGGGVVIGIFIGLILGAVLAAGAAWYFTSTMPFMKEPASVRQPGKQQPITLPGQPGGQPVVKQDFGFYDMLKQGSDQAPAPAKNPSPAQVQSVTPAAPEVVAMNAPAASASIPQLYLQTGAFENPAEADNMKALLMLNGIDASVQRAKLSDGRIMHRVRIGPFNKPEDMGSTRAQLNAVGMNASVVRAGS